MLRWSTIVSGAALSGAVAAALLIVLERRRVSRVVLAVAAVSAVAAPIGWNAVLRATHAREFFTDAPIAAFPVSWQDAGSGVVTFALTSALLGLGPLARDG